MRKTGLIRRVNLSLHLTPSLSNADSRAMQQLQKWHQSIDISGGIDDANMEIRTFHRNIYLAGLQLYLMNPTLCHHVAESLGREDLSFEALLQELQSHASDDSSSQLQVKVQKIHEDVEKLLLKMEEQITSLQELRETKTNDKNIISARSKEQEELDLSQFGIPIDKMKKIKSKGVF